MNRPQRVGHNVKGRQSTAGSRKKGKRKRSNLVERPELEVDANATILTPKSKEDKDTERREKLLQELAVQAESKWNNKKKKRLEKYIDKKLKKDERLLIFEKLTKSQASLPSALLQSSSSLGTGKVSTYQERLERVEDKEVKLALNGRFGKRKRDGEYAVTGPQDRESDDSDEDQDTMEDTTTRTHKRRDLVGVDNSANDIPPHNINSPPVGSALQRNPDGTVVAPKIKLKSEGIKSLQKGWGSRKPMPVQKEDSGSSIDSSNSAYDSSDGTEESIDDESDSSSSGEEQEDVPVAVQEPALLKKKTLGFKDWAMKQLSIAKGYQSNGSAQDDIAQLAPPPKKRKLDVAGLQEMRGPLGEDIKLPETTFAKHLLDPERQMTASFPLVKTVQVKRLQDVEATRILLPIVTEEQPIMEALLLNPVVIICGETGSGKTTQVPQFLYEAGFGTPGSENPGMIGITQPRRVAAMSMAARVAHELCLTSSRVSYQIRYDATVSPLTSIKFMTDGVLLRELATDFLLLKYSVVIIDEAHERSMNTDILIGVLSRVINLRENMWKESGTKPLRLIIMSATLRISDFAENTTLFSSPPPVINVAARQYPVTIHFNRRTSSDYVTASIKKATKIHTRLPPGGILIFLTGQNEIIGVCKRLGAKFSKKALEEKKRRQGYFQNRSKPEDEEDVLERRAVAPARADVEAEDVDLGGAAPDVNPDVDDGLDDEDPEALDSDDERGLEEEIGQDADEFDTPMHIIPLYSLLPSEKQMRVFEPPPEGSRLVVVSTNVAETSLTIPGIRYVVDSGRAKERRYDVTNGIQAFQISWTSKASALQRAGRAGRTGPGHCYRLYSSALFEHHFEQFSSPEIHRMPIEGVVLQMKSMHIDAVVNFPFPTPPDRSTLQKAEKTLTHLGALSVVAPSLGRAPVKGVISGGQISELGKTMALFPLSPRFSRMLVSGQQHGCLPYIVSIVSAMSVGDPFVYEEAIRGKDSDSDSDITPETAGLKSQAVRAKEARRSHRKAFFQSQHTHASLGNFSSDMFKVLSVVGAYEYAGGGQKFCSEHFVRPKAMEEIHKLRAQISHIVQVNFPGLDAGFAPNLPPPTDFQLKVIRQLLTAGLIDQVAVRKDIIERNQATGTQYSTSKGVPYRALGISEEVFIHPSSVLFSHSPPDYVVFHEIIRTSRIYLKGLTIVNPAWLASLGKPSLCTFSKPMKNNVGALMVVPHFGPEGWELPAMKAVI